MTVESPPNLRTVDVRGLRMAYREAGTGRPIVLLHGNPTSSYLWRRVIPALAPSGRIVAPDLPGMGESEALPDPASYRFVHQREHLADFLHVLGVDTDLVLVGHDWGGALALDWACHHQDQVRAVAYTETMLRPRAWKDEPPEGQDLFRSLRSAAGEQLVLSDNVFIEKVLAGATRHLSPEDLDVYRAPYVVPGESRRPMLTWAREIPFDGDPADVHRLIHEYATWLTTTSVPKLLIAAVPGAILTGDARAHAESLPNQRVVEVEAGHFVPEDAPEDLARAITEWLTDLPD